MIVKMGPLCMTGHLSLFHILLLLLLISLFVNNVSPLLVYDHQTFLDICDSVIKPRIYDWSGQSEMLPPFLASVPHYLRCLPVPLPCKHCHRKWGKWSGPCLTASPPDPVLGVWSSSPAAVSPEIWQLHRADQLFQMAATHIPAARSALSTELE